MNRGNKLPELSVIIPAYNEEARLGPKLGSVLRYLDAKYPNHELLVVDDGSSDNTAEVVRNILGSRANSKLITYFPNRGKGYAVRTGVLASKGKYVLFMDADLSTPLSEIPHILKLVQNSDIVIGSRGAAQAKIHTRPSLFRRFASVVFDQVKYAMVGLRRFKDTQCGFKAYQGKVARQLFSYTKIDRFMFDVEVLYLAERSGLKIVEMPVHWSDMPGSKVRFFEGVINMFRDLWRIKKIHLNTPKIRP